MKPPLRHPRMFTVAQVAQIAGVSKMTIYRLISDKELRAYRIGRSIRVSSDDVTVFLRDASTVLEYRVADEERA